ncbi:MAG TPA: pesticin C-terminus-like muramidase [Paracoccaceae bacterium]|nr:pesticin C-terminus-like muramidase [Paracoccaceae bacterium]
MPDRIDYAFIAAREGGIRLDGYVPDALLSGSGVTIATGFDLGQRRRSDLVALGLPSRLTDQLAPYLGAKRQDARKLIGERPLRITMADALLINRTFKQKFVKELAAAYAASPHNSREKAFFELPAQAQTVIASVAFQYGNLASEAPRFWQAACARDWPATIAELRNFGDSYDSRRHLEADLLATMTRATVAEAAR